MRHSGMLNLLWEASERGEEAKILIQTDDDEIAEETVQKNIRQKKLPINVQYIKKSLQTKITTLVIDQSVSLAIEVNDDTKETFQEATGIAICSTNLQFYLAFLYSKPFGSSLNLINRKG
jgi:hypothetical protein